MPAGLEKKNARIIWNYEDNGSFKKPRKFRGELILEDFGKIAGKNAETFTSRMYTIPLEGTVKKIHKFVVLQHTHNL